MQPTSAEPSDPARFDERERALATQAAVLDALPAGIALLDHESRIVAVNRTWRTLGDAQGLKLPDHGVGANYLQVCDKAGGDEEPEARAVAAGLRGVLYGESSRFDFEYACHSPLEQRWFRLAITPVRAPGFAGAVVAHLDITERRSAEQSLQSSAATLAERAALLDQARDAALVCGLDDRVTYWSRSAERLYGWSAADAVDRPRNEVAPVDSAILEEAKRSVLQLGEWHGEFSTSTRSGQDLIVDSSWTLLRDATGVPQSVLMIDTDVSERRLAEAQFLRAQRMESIGTLAGGIAHDLNNALAPVVMSIAVLRLGEKDPKRQKLLGTLEAAARRGGDMVRQVLSFSRGLEGRRIEVSTDRLLRDIRAVVDDTFLKAVEVQARIPAGLWPVSGDPTQLHQVLVNLCVNARDAMPAGGTLTLAAENVTLDEAASAREPGSHPGRYVVLSVEDTGTGMSREVQERIFDPFFSTKEADRGTGLGLSTALAIVKGHGGFMRVYSAPERGSKFCCYLPARVEQEAEWDTGEPEVLPRGAGQLIVVVDDEEAVREVTRETLEMFGYRVLLAPDGPTAISQCAANPGVALVLTDMMMPMMDGASLVLVLRRMNPALRIVGASGLYVNEKIARAIDAGVDSFLSKPFTAATLLRTLDDLLRRRK